MYIINLISNCFNENMFVFKHNIIDYGSFGYVYKIYVNSSTYAIKIFKDFNNNEFNNNELEFAKKYITQKLYYPNIVQYLSIGYIIYPSDLKLHRKKCIIMKYYTPLRKHLDLLNNKNMFSVNTITKILVDVFYASKWLISNFNIVHSDIKYDNILVDTETNNFILSDFGIINKPFEYFVDINKNKFDGDVSMFPYYKCYYQKYLLYSIAILMLNIMGTSKLSLNSIDNNNYIQIIDDSLNIANINEPHLKNIIQLMINNNYFYPTYFDYYIKKYK